LRGDPRGWWYLAPVAVLTLVVFHWLWRGVRVREFATLGSHNFTPVFSRGIYFAGDRIHNVPRHLRQRKGSVAAKHMLSAAALALPRLSRSGPLERWLGVWLTPPEHDLCVLMFPYRAQFTKVWSAAVLMVIPVAAMLALTAYLERQVQYIAIPRREYHGVAMMFLPAILALLCCTSSRWLNVMHPRHPVVLRAVHATLTKLVWLHLPWWLLAWLPLVWLELQLAGTMQLGLFYMVVKTLVWLWVAPRLCIASLIGASGDKRELTWSDLPAVLLAFATAGSLLTSLMPFHIWHLVGSSVALLITVELVYLWSLHSYYHTPRHFAAET
jgi:hypothetical protein